MSFVERLGNLLFKWRSFTPLLLAPIALPLLWRSRGGGGLAWTLVGFSLCAIGQALRAWVLGQVPDGTSGQNEVLIATQLNTSGPYAHARNPLYLGNLGITLGLCVIAHEWIILIVVASLFAIQYHAIIAAEEGFLRRQFGAAYDDYCAKVPRFWPSWRKRVDSPERPFSPRRALYKEHNPAASWLLLALVLLGWDAHRRAESLVPHAAAAGALVLAYLAVKGVKHHWFTGGFWRDMRRRVRETAR
jgi:protein-S-isoprenylcysteine O-methyltransferase Ste14